MPLVQTLAEARRREVKTPLSQLYPIGHSKLIDETKIQKFGADSASGKAALARLQTYDPKTYGTPGSTTKTTSPLDTLTSSGSTIPTSGGSQPLTGAITNAKQPDSAYQLDSGDAVRTGGTETTQNSRLSDTESISTLTKLLETLTSKGDESTKRGTPETEDALKNLIAAAPKFFEQFGKQNAITDSKGAVDAIVKDILNRGIPGINTESTISGGWDNTSIKILQDNLVAQAAGEGAKLQQQTVRDYADITTTAAGLIDSLIGRGQSGLENTTRTDSKTSTSEQNSTEARNLQRLLEDLTTSQDFVNQLPAGIQTEGQASRSANAKQASQDRLLKMFLGA